MILGMLFGLFIASTASAQLLFQDSFSYPNGPLLTAPGSTWVNNYAPSNQINVVNGELFLNQTNHESVRVDFPTAKGYSETNMYASFTVRFTALPKGNGRFFAFFRAHDTDGLFCRVWASTNGAAPGKFRLGINVISYAPQMIATDLSLGVTYTVVASAADTNDTGIATLWINPRSEADTTMKAQDTQGFFGYLFGHFGFKQISPSDPVQDGIGDLFVDNVRIGFSFNSVMSLRLTDIENLGVGGMKLRGAGTAGTNYAVLANTNLNTTNWVNIGSATANSSGTIQFTDTNAKDHPRRFYRLTNP